MSTYKDCQDRPTPSSEVKLSSCQELWIPQEGQEPKTPEIFQVEEPPSPPPSLALPPPVERLALPPIPPKKVHRPVQAVPTTRRLALPQIPPSIPLKSVLPAPTPALLALPPIPRKKIQPVGPSVRSRAIRKTLPTLPDAASITIDRTANHRIRQSQPSNRPRMTKNPRSSPFHCRHCQVTCTGRVQYFEHLRSRRHQLNTSKDRHECEICQLRLTGKKDLDRHLSGKVHRRTVKKQ